MTLTYADYVELKRMFDAMEPGEAAKLLMAGLAAQPRWRPGDMVSFAPGEYGTDTVAPIESQAPPSSFVGLAERIAALEHERDEMRVVAERMHARINVLEGFRRATTDSPVQYGDSRMLR